MKKYIFGFLSTLTLLFVGCVTLQQKALKDTPPVKLEWEQGHPERAVWTQALMAEAAQKQASFDKATDWPTFCPGYAKLDSGTKQQVIATLIEWVAYYESSWDPTNNSVDVGQQDDPNSWSVGLLQMSVTDQQNYGFGFGYTFKDLQDGPKNLHLGMAIMGRQLERYRLIAIPAGHKGLYWSTLHPGGKYDQTQPIARKTRAIRGC